MNILLVGNADSLILKEFIEHVLLNNNNIISILTTNAVSRYVDFYNKNNILIIDTNNQTAAEKHCKKNKDYIACIKNFIKRFLPETLSCMIRNYRIKPLNENIVSGIGKIDVIHFHYTDYETSSIYKYIYANCRRIFVTYWGSDLLRGPSYPFNTALLDKAERIICPTSNLTRKFTSIYSSKYDSKLTTLALGTDAFDALNRVLDKHERQENHKEYFSIPPHKIAIMIGYNAIPEQRHCEVINTISGIDKNIRDKIHLVVQLSYPDNPSYKEKVCSALKASGFSWTSIDTFLDHDETAILRNAIDIFIHAQTTDALSFSLLEYLYADTFVFNASWLYYKELVDANITYYTFDTFDELKIKIEKFAMTYKGKTHSSRNRDILYKMKSWQAVAPSWQALYNLATQ